MVLKASYHVQRHSAAQFAPGVRPKSCTTLTCVYCDSLDRPIHCLRPPAEIEDETKLYNGDQDRANRLVCIPMVDLSETPNWGSEPCSSYQARMDTFNVHEERRSLASNNAVKWNHSTSRAVNVRAFLCIASTPSRWDSLAGNRAANIPGLRMNGDKRRSPGYPPG